MRTEAAPDGFLIADGTCPLAVGVASAAMLRGAPRDAPFAPEVVAAARRAKRRERAQYRRRCARLGVVVGTPVRGVVVHGLPGGFGGRLSGGGRTALVVVPDALVEDADVNVWAFILRRVRGAPRAEPERW